MEAADFQNLLNWISQHPALANASVFLVALAESLFIVGILVPGAAMMIGFGALIGTGTLDFWTTAFWATLGAIAGDGISFWIGYRFRDRIPELRFFRKRKLILERGKVFFEKHGGKSIALGRFVGPIRAVIPTIGGMLHMPPATFFIINVISAIVWAPAYLLPGVIVGASVTLATQIATRLTIVIVVLFTIAWLLFRVLKSLLFILDKHGDVFFNRLIDWCNGHPFIGRLTIPLFDPKLSPIKGIAFWSTLFALSFAVFIACLFFLFDSDISAFNENSGNFVRNFRYSGFDQLSILLLRSIQTFSLIAVFIVATLILRNRQLAVYFISAVLISLLFVYGMNLFGSETNTNNGEFSQYQLALVVVIYGFLAIIFSNQRPLAWRRFIYGVVILYVLATLLASVYQNRLPLVTGIIGISFGYLWLTIIGLAFRRHLVTGRVNSSPIAVILVAVIVIWFTQLIWFDERVSTNSSLEHPNSVHTLTWLKNNWLKLSTPRIDIGGEKKQQLNIVWVGNEHDIRNFLAGQGWQSSEPEKFLGKLLAFDKNVKPKSTPALPLLRHGQFANITFVRDENDSSTQVIRLWRLDMKLEDSNAYIYVGNVLTQSLERTILGIPIISTSDNSLSPIFSSEFVAEGSSVASPEQEIRPALYALYIDDRVVDTK